MFQNLARASWFPGHPNNVIEPTTAPSSNEIVGSVQPLPHVYLHLLDSDHCRSRKPQNRTEGLLEFGARCSMGDVAQRESACFPCLRAWVHSQASSKQSSHLADIFYNHLKQGFTVMHEVFPLVLSVTQLDTFQTKSLIHLPAAHLTSAELSW